jgi:uncharacterized protein (TIGR02001 family)
MTRMFAMPIPMPPSLPTVAVSAGVASDYAFRGVSRTDGHVEGFGALDLGLADGYAGVFASNVDMGPRGAVRSGAEADVYGGWRPEAFGYSFDLGAQYDSFSGVGGGFDYAEVYAKVSRSIGPVTGRLQVHYSPAFTAHAGQAWYAEAGADYAIDRVWTASAAVGVQRVSHDNPLAANHVTWNAGITRTLGDHLAFDVRYVDTDRHDAGRTYGPKLVGQVRVSF